MLQVRHYSVEQRAALQSQDPATFRAALAHYLSDLQRCPLRLEAGNEAAVLQWLLTFAGGCA